MMIKEFFEFMRKREAIRLAKEAGKPRDEWTNDPVLKVYKFTNVKRQHDWTTRELMARFYPNLDTNGGQWDPQEYLLNATMARFFGLAGTVIEIGWICDMSDESQARILNVVANRYRRGDSVFTGAYIVPNCGDPRPKHEIVLDVLREVVTFKDIGAITTFREFVKDLTRIKGFGSFMAKEVLLDYYLASRTKPADWEVWTPVGPGACRGASRVTNYSSDPPGSLYPALKEKKALEVVQRLYDEYTNNTDLWPEEWVELDLCDIQFQLCEFDKYMRATRPGEGSRPKAKYSPRQVK